MVLVENVTIKEKSVNMSFDLKDFLPYLLNRAAEQSSLEFQQVYKDRYGMLRTEWRVLFHLGHYGEMTAREVCERGGLHKTKVSRAVAALDKKHLVERKPLPEDRRFEILRLSKSGLQVYEDLIERAEEFQHKTIKNLSREDAKVMTRCLRQLARI